ncbi:Negative elongation factor C/D [Strongyloides ratti]|uniref:Negative elongation factor C/D n=1 Tax=Strongyloides ratti TaxID=34506 RepID=A0A090LAV7_STRRB|nr:Negative elongation factor C/D [Strongyloides ratti]CEF64655.1 Negative elongation factor C/D [Strongyloides ratti]
MEENGHNEKNNVGENIDDKDIISVAREALCLPDAILQPNIEEIVDTYMSHGGTEDEVFDMLSGSFEGTLQMANELACLLTDITYERLDSTESRLKKKSRKKKTKTEDDLPSISPEVGEIVIDAVKKVLIKNFNPEVADKIIESNQGDVAVNIVNSLTNNESWRPVVYKLIQEHPNSSLLSVCLKFISQLGYHNEICNIPMATNQLDIFSRIVSSSLTKLIQSHENGTGTEEYDKAFEEFVKIAAFGEHSYIFTTSLLLNMINSNDGKKKCTLGHIFEELNIYCYNKDYDYTVSTISMINNTINPIPSDIISAYQTMIRKKNVNPTDILTLYNAYSSSSPPPIHFLRDIVFMDLLINVIFTKDTSLNIKNQRHTYVYLLAYSACVVEKVNETKRIHCKQELEPLIEEINKFLKIIDNSEDFGIVFNTLEELIKQPLIAAGCLQYIKSSITAHKYAVEPNTSHYVLIDEIGNIHINLRDRVFQTLNLIFAHISSLSNESAEVIIQKQKYIIHRYIHLLSTGYCIPVIRHLEQMYKTNQMDVSLMRLFAVEVIEIISGPYSQEFSQTFLPILLNTDIFHDDIFDKMNLNCLVEEMESV